MTNDDTKTKFKLGQRVTHTKLTGPLTVVGAWIQPASTVPGATWAEFATYILRDQHGEDFTTSEEACMSLAVMTSEQKAEACMIFHDCKGDAYEQAGALINAQGGCRDGRLHQRLALRLAIAFVACELFVTEAEVEAVLKGEGEIE